MRALVDRIEPVVAVELLDLVVARVAVAAVHLDREIVRFQAPLRRPALGDRREYVQQQASLGARCRGFPGFLFIHQARAVQAQRQAALDVGFLREKHAAHIGVLDDGHLR